MDKYFYAIKRKIDERFAHAFGKEKPMWTLYRFRTVSERNKWVEDGQPYSPVFDYREPITRRKVEYSIRKKDFIPVTYLL
jgi:hypothetical protein